MIHRHLQRSQTHLLGLTLPPGRPIVDLTGLGYFDGLDAADHHALCDPRQAVLLGDLNSNALPPAVFRTRLLA